MHDSKISSKIVDEMRKKKLKLFKNNHNDKYFENIPAIKSNMEAYLLGRMQMQIIAELETCERFEFFFSIFLIHAQNIW